MIGLAMYTTILTLYKQGNSQRQIARVTGHDRKTVKRIVSRFITSGLESPPIIERESKVNKWHQEIIGLLEKDLSCVRVKEELKLLGFTGSYSGLTRYIKRIKLNSNICIRFNTAPGEEAQVDFGDIGKRYDPAYKLRKAYIFNMRLSYSRKDYYEIVFNQEVTTWIKCHINAFRYFNGVPSVVKLDNLKAAVIVANFYDPIYQEQYKRFADHYGFLPAPCRVGQPQEKGKTESGIKYVCGNFFAGRTFSNYVEMNEALNNWLEYKCNDRIHGTTKKKPNELFNNEEAGTLGVLPETEFDLSSWHKRKVAKDCHISLANNYYSVPSSYAGKEVEVSLGTDIVKIYAEGETIATHNRATGKGTFITNRSHWPEYKLYYPEAKEYQDKCILEMQEIGEYAGKMLSFVRERQKKDWPKTIKGLLRLRKMYGDEILDKACMRALHFGIGNYSKIKEIIKNNCYNLPLPEAGGEYAGII